MIINLLINVYEGDWKNDVQQGKGTYSWANGNKYIGERKNNMFEGKGKIIFVNG